MGAAARTTLPTQDLEARGAKTAARGRGVEFDVAAERSVDRLSAAIDQAAPAARLVLLCGDAAEIDAVADRLPRASTPAPQESVLAFVDRSAGNDVDDEIDAVVFLDRSKDAAAAAEMLRNLRAVMDRSFHNAPIVVATSAPGGEASAFAGPADRVVQI